MGRTIIQIQAFLASPFDVADERRFVGEVVADLNRTIAPHLGFLIRLIRWEDMVPSIEERAQQVVFDQANFDAIDIFIGVLWNRFGTPTGRADSGTQEEFNLAYHLWQKFKKPHIMLYFSQQAANLVKKNELEQKLSVLNFRDMISEKGLFREFTTPQEFESIFRQDMICHLLNIKDILDNQSKLKEQENKKVGLTKNTAPKVPDGMIRIPSGKFLAGRACIKTEIDYDFFIDEVPVTNKDFFLFMEKTGFMMMHPRAEISKALNYIETKAKDYPDHPVTYVTWFDAQAFAAWKGKRLPTSLEWERASRGIDGRQYPWGNEFDSLKCNCEEARIFKTTPVYNYPNGRSPDGIFDMVGNVFEWVNDWATSPRFSSAPNSEKVNRGASYNRPATDLICWYTESDPPDLRMTDVGFRCAWTP